MSENAQHAVPRRTVVALAGAGAALPLLAACGSSGDSTATDPADSASSSGSGGSSGASGTTGGGSGTALTPTSDIPVGGAKVFSDESVVVTQPKTGEFKCFSSICTHQGCTVAAGSTLNCPCHGSSYSITDGSVLGGPAPSPLPAKQIQVKGGEIYLES